MQQTRRLLQFGDLARAHHTYWPGHHKIDNVLDNQKASAQPKNKSVLRKIYLIGFVIAAAIAGLLGYGVKGWFDARQDAAGLQARALEIVAAGRGAHSLRPDRLWALLQVQDPGFYDHSGVDFSTPGAGYTTLTQSLSKRLAFGEFIPGIRKIRQTGYALGLDSILSKDLQIALFLETAEMGNSDQGWVTGFHNASQVFFKTPLNDITDTQFYALVAALIAPAQLEIQRPGPKLDERIRRISRLVNEECQPLDFSDVWLEGCK